MTIEVYTFERKDGTSVDWSTQDADEAREYAKAEGLRWIANRFEFADSELVADYT